MPDSRKKSQRVRDFKQKRRELREIVARTGDLSILAQPDSHYHLMFNARPNLTQGFGTHVQAMREMAKIADAHEPHVVYYEEGMIQLTQAKLPGRTGTFRIIVQTGICNRLCANVQQSPILRLERKN